MKLAQRHISKIDPLLREALQHADGDEVFRAVMVLGTDQEDRGEKKLAPAQFRSRSAYRGAMIDRRQRQLNDDIGGTLRALQALSLFPRGGTISRTIVIEGPARQILNSLELPGIRHATLDQPLELIKPSPRGRKRLK
jgi:hypothetical protein